MSTLTVPLRQHPTPAAREIGLRVINNVLPAYAAGLHTGDAAHLAHEAERLDSLPASPVIGAMRALVDSERAWRRHLARMGAGR
ncbi:MAG TPA: hypothetical protein VE198_18565 [Actinoallomurus sp.]|nr:hypothetical protein [Actinoallomurus sp.]